MKLYIDKNLGISEDKSRLMADFCIFCAKLTY